MTTTRTTSFTKSGFLLKRGELNKAWRVRWFVLAEDKLYYYRSSDEPKPISYIPLDQTMARICQEKSEKDFCFEIVTKQRVYQLVAANHQDMVDWLRALASHTILHHENELIAQAEEMLEGIANDEFMKEEGEQYEQIHKLYNKIQQEKHLTQLLNINSSYLVNNYGSNSSSGNNSAANSFSEKYSNIVTIDNNMASTSSASKPTLQKSSSSSFRKLLVSADDDLDDEQYASPPSDNNNNTNKYMNKYFNATPQTPDNNNKSATLDTPKTNKPIHSLSGEYVPFSSRIQRSQTQPPAVTESRSTDSNPLE